MAETNTLQTLASDIVPLIQQGFYYYFNFLHTQTELSNMHYFSVKSWTDVSLRWYFVMQDKCQLGPKTAEQQIFPKSHFWKT